MKKFVLSIICFFVAVAPVLADEPVATVNLSLRMVKAFHTGKAPEKPVLDKRLKDVKSKFANLPYAHYKIISSSVFPLQLKKKRVVRLASGQKLKLRVLDSSPEFTNIWVHWADVDKTELLDARFRFKNTERIVTGTDASDNSAYIMVLGLEK